MKSYTDLEQSKKLAEILPLESADMHYTVVGNAVTGDYQSGISNARSVAKGWKKNPDEFAKNVIPCWSLTTLLDVLPSATLDSSDDRHYRLHCNGKFTDWHNNPIDACYEMIIKLHEQNLL